MPPHNRPCRAWTHSSTIFSCGTSRDQTVRSANWYTGSRALIRRPTVASGSAVCSSGRSNRRFTLRMMMSMSAFSQIDTALSRMRSRVSWRMKAPPPVASTAGPLSRSRAITRASPSLKSGSPRDSKISGIDMPAAVSISVSASRKGSPSRADKRRPIVDLPAPIMPTSTTERPPSAALISASWIIAVLAGETVSGISSLKAVTDAAFRATILPPPIPLLVRRRDPCNGMANMVVVRSGQFPMHSNG